MSLVSIFLDTFAPAIGNAVTDDYGVDLAVRYQLRTEHAVDGWISVAPADGEDR